MGASFPEAKVELGRHATVTLHSSLRVCKAPLPPAPGARSRRFPVAISEGPYPFPSRTRKSSPPEPMVLHALRVGEWVAAGISPRRPAAHHEPRGVAFCRTGR